MFGAGPRPAPVPGLGLNAGNYLRLRPCPVWKGGPDASGNVPVGVPGTESYRQYLHRINRWVLTGQRVGVPNGMMASEISEALPDGARKATDSIPAEALLDDGWLCVRPWSELAKPRPLSTRKCICYRVGPWHMNSSNLYITKHSLKYKWAYKMHYSLRCR